MNRVLALSLRPTCLNDLIGQDEIIKCIENQFRSKRIPHSFIISGSSGCGKTTISRILSKMIHKYYLNQDINSPNCSEKHFETKEINAANYTGIDDIRKIIEQMKFKPMPPSKAKIVILDEAHQLSLAAQNALLTETEDVHEHVFYIFCTSNISKIIPALQRRGFIIKPKQLHNKESLKVFIEKTFKMANFNKDSENLLRYLIEYEISSPGIILQIIERYISGLNEIDSICPSNELGISSNIDMLALCRNIASGNWTGCSKILKTINKTDVIPIKASVVGYLKSILLNSTGKKAYNCSKAIQQFPLNSELEDTNGISSLLAAICISCGYFS